MHNEAKTPLIRLAKREGIRPTSTWLIRIASILVALLLGSFIIMITGVNPIDAYGTMIKGSLGSKVYLQQTIKIAIAIALGIGIVISLPRFFFTLRKASAVSKKG